MAHQMQHVQVYSQVADDDTGKLERALEFGDMLFKGVLQFEKYTVSQVVSIWTSKDLYIVLVKIQLS